jgi:hypothetical protein
MHKVKINITIDESLCDWLNEQRGMVPLSTYINHLLSGRKEAEELITNYSKDSSNIKNYIRKSMAKIKGGDRFLEILSKEYLEEV